MSKAQYPPRCPGCGYDGSAYGDGTHGWVDESDPDLEPICASCCEPAREEKPAK